MNNIQLYTQILKNDLLSRIDSQDLWNKADLKFEIIDALSESTAKYVDIITLPHNQRPQMDIPDIPISSLEGAEKERISQVLKATNWHISNSAKSLGIDRKTLRNKIKRFGLVNDVEF